MLLVLHLLLEVVPSLVDLLLVGSLDAFVDMTASFARDEIMRARFLEQGVAERVQDAKAEFALLTVQDAARVQIQIRQVVRQPYLVVECFLLFHFSHLL